MSDQAATRILEAGIVALHASLKLPAAPAPYARELARRLIAALAAHGLEITAVERPVVGELTIPASEAQLLLIVPCALANAKTLVQAQEVWDTYVRPAENILSVASWIELRDAMHTRCAVILREMTS